MVETCAKHNTYNTHEPVVTESTASRHHEHDPNLVGLSCIHSDYVYSSGSSSTSSSCDDSSDKDDKDNTMITTTHTVETNDHHHHDIHHCHHESRLHGEKRGDASTSTATMSTNDDGMTHTTTMTTTDMMKDKHGAIISNTQVINTGIQHSGMDQDEMSGEIDREYTGQFEGPEKTLEVCFRRKDGQEMDEMSSFAPTGIIDPHMKAGLRLLQRHELDQICKRARCTILSSISNQYLDAYVLSESSLFVYNYMIIIKTCGTTTLLRCLALVIELGRRLGLELDWVGYSRKNFNFPDDQCFPHGSFTQELEYLYGHKKLCDKLDGNGYTLGPITDDHWFVFVADQTIRSKPELDNDRVLNIMMFDIDPDVADIFYYNKYAPKGENESEDEAVKRISFAQTKAAGIDALCPGALFDPRAFEPCGYSMNAVLYKSYYTMHITPEEGSSYASFETNQKLASYTSLISNVVRSFKPRRFIMTMMADEGALKEISGNPLLETAGYSRIKVPSKVKGGSEIVYKRTNIASINVEDDSSCMMGNWTIAQDLKNTETEKRNRFMSFA
jgi:S-adenosylmethionine decarboxylase